MGGFLQACLRGLIGERRKGLRENAQGVVFLFLRGQLLGHAVLVDRSSDGARLSGEDALLSAADMFLIPERAEAAFYTVARQVPGGVGVQITSIRSMRGYVGADLEPVKRAWVRLRSEGLRVPPPRG